MLWVSYQTLKPIAVSILFKPTLVSLWSLMLSVNQQKTPTESAGVWAFKTRVL